MSVYRDPSDIVRRCLAMLEGKITPQEYDVTFMLCLSLGLLVIPKQKVGKETNAIPNDGWTELWLKFNENTASSVNDVAWHLRNAICHAGIMVKSDGDSDSITSIEFEDIKPNREKKKPITYQKQEQIAKVELTIDEFKKFIVEYAEYYLTHLEEFERG